MHDRKFILNSGINQRFFILKYRTNSAFAPPTPNPSHHENRKYKFDFHGEMSTHPGMRADPDATLRGA
jgi:hypothetical protein